MNSYLISSTTQLVTVLATSLLFVITSMYFQKMCKKQDTILHFWYLVSVLCGLISSFLIFILTISSLAVGSEEDTTNINIVWYAGWYTTYAQISTFLTAYILDVFYTLSGKSPDTLPLNVNDSSNTYSNKFTLKLFGISLMILLIVAISLGLLGTCVVLLV